MRGGRPGQEIALDSIDWAKLVPEGAMVVWGQASAEPTTLTASLIAQRATIGHFRAFVGMSWGDSVSSDHGDHVSFSSYCGAGANRLLGDALDILPIPYSDLAPTLAKDRPILLLSLGPGSGPDSFGYGAGREYLADLSDTASLVIAEVNDRLPRSSSRDGEIPRDCIDLFIRTSNVPLSAAAATPARSNRGLQHASRI